MRSVALLQKARESALGGEWPCEKKKKKTPALFFSLFQVAPLDASCFSSSPPPDPSPHRRIVPALSPGQHGVAAGPRRRGLLRVGSSSSLNRRNRRVAAREIKALSFCSHRWTESEFRRDARESRLLATQQAGDRKERLFRGETNKGSRKGGNDFERRFACRVENEKSERAAKNDESTEGR